MSVRQFISAYRWPMLLIGLLAMSITAQAVLVFVATRRDSPAPIDNYYQRAQAWDAGRTLLRAPRGTLVARSRRDLNSSAPLLERDSPVAENGAS